MTRIRHFWRIALVAGILTAVGLGINAVVTLFNASWGDPWRWFVPAVVTVVVSMLQAGGEALAAERQEPQITAERQRAGIPAATAFAIVILVFGLLGVAAAAGVRYLVDWATGNEAVVSKRLDTSTPTTLAALEAQVTAFDETTHFTRVEVNVNNSGDFPVTIVDGYCSVTAATGNLAVVTIPSKWERTKPPNVTQKSILTFEGQLPPKATSATVFCGFVSAMGGSFEDQKTYHKGLSLPITVKRRG